MLNAIDADVCKTVALSQQLASHPISGMPRVSCMQLHGITTINAVSVEGSA